MKHPLARLVFWLALLLAVFLVGQSVVLAHQIRTRGLPDGFPAPVTGADVPVLGVNVALEQYEDAGLDAALTRVAEGGFVWVRQSFCWSQVEPVPGGFDWRGSDRFMAALARHPHLRLVAVLDDCPATPPFDPDRFAAFAGGFAAHYGAQVDHYQIWDEPNLADHWGGGPVNPAAYADLLARAARAIRAVDPNARILLAGLAPTAETGPQNLSDARYLERLYQVGAAPYFDIVAGKPYGFDTAPNDRRVDEAILNFSRLLLLREVMVEHGDAGKPVWASHWGWNALPGPSTGTGQDWTGLPSIWGQTDEPTQAARTIAALERVRSEWPWAGALILEHFQPAASPDDPRWGFALVGRDGAPGLVYQAVRTWAAALPNGAPVGGYLARNRWATYEGDWLVGPLGADVGGPAALTTGSDGSRATFRFEGPSVALTVRRGPYRAFLYVTVDGVPANALPQDAMGRAYAVLYDSLPSVATVPLATGLSAGIHTVEVLAEGGQGQWSLVDWRVGPTPVQDGYRWKLGVLAVAVLALVALLVRDVRRVAWGDLARQFLAWPEWVQVTLVAGLAGLLWATASVSWGQGLYSTAHASLPTTQSLFPASCFLLSLLTLPLLAALLSLRPDLGLSLVALTAPFYLRPADMFYQALSLPGILVLLCGIGIVCHRLRITPRTCESTNLRIPESTSPHLSPIDRGVALLILAAVVATLAAANWRAAFFELLTVFLFPALYYALLRLTRLDDQARWRIVDGLVLGGVSVAVVGLVQYVSGHNVVAAEGGLPRLQSVYPSPNNVGLYLGRAWPLLLAVAVLPGGAPEGMTSVWKRRRRFYRLVLVPVTLALALSFSRGALLLGIPAALVVMGWQAGGRHRWAALALVLVGALALMPLLRVPRFASMLDLRQGSTFFRLELWRSSLMLIREHPWFGIGPGNFLDAYRTRYVLPSAWQEFNLEHPHNVYLDHWTRLGLVGLLAGVGVQGAFWLTVRRKRKDPGFGIRDSELLVLGFVGGIASLLAHGLVDNTVFYPDLALTFFLMLGIIQSNGVSERMPNAFETI